MATLMKPPADEMTEADKAFGYRFACDGLMSLEEARQWLGNVSESTLDRWATELVGDTGRTRIRKESRGRRKMFCRRSVKEFASNGDRC